MCIENHHLTFCTTVSFLIGSFYSKNKFTFFYTKTMDLVINHPFFILHLQIFEFYSNMIFDYKKIYNNYELFLINEAIRI
jgi:hypothetical protein